MLLLSCTVGNYVKGIAMELSHLFYGMLWSYSLWL